MNIGNAKEMALKEINRYFDLSGHNDETVIVDEATREFSAGWVFFYNSKRFLESGDNNFMLVGNKPVFVGRSGQVVPFLDPLEDLAKQVENIS